jgi:hypothetical protein
MCLLPDCNTVVDSRNILLESSYDDITSLGMNMLMHDGCADVPQLPVDAGADLALNDKGQSLVDIAENKSDAKTLKVLQASWLGSEEQRDPLWLQEPGESGCEEQVDPWERDDER